MQKAITPLHAISALLIAAILVLAGTGTITAQMDMQSEDSIIVSGTLGDMGFYAGGEVVVSATSEDDIFVAGGNISLSGTGADHLLVAGGEIAATDIAVKDLIVAGGNIQLNSGTIGDDIVAAAGNISLHEGMSVGGSGVLTGGNIEIDTDIGGELTASAGNVVLNGSVGGDTLITAGNIEIGPDVVINGNLTYAADEFSMDPSATVTGEIIIEEYEGGNDGFSIEGMIALFAGMIIFLIGLGILILIIAAVFPALMNRSNAMIASRPLTALGYGLLTFILLPVAGLVFMVTFFGIPAGIVLLSLNTVLWVFAFAAFLYFGGMKLRGMFGHRDEPYVVARIVWTLAAGVIILIVGFIPIVGFLVWLAGLWIGMGAIVTQGGAALAED